MSRGSVNKVILIGNLGADPEVRSMPNGNYVANINIATTESWRDRNSGDTQEKTEWHRVVLFRRLAEIAQQYLRKGSKVFVEGRLQTRKWQDQNGQDRYSTEVVCDNLQMLDSRAGGMDGGAPPMSRSSPPPQGQGGQGMPNYGLSSDYERFDGPDDDIPF